MQNGLSSTHMQIVQCMSNYSSCFFLSCLAYSTMNLTIPSQLLHVKSKLPCKNGAATTTAALLEKQVSFQPRKSRRISPKNAVVADNSTWVELLVVSRKKGSNRSRSLFYNIQSRHAYWDEPPSGASEVVYLGDLERLNAVMASVERKQQIYRESCLSVAAAAAKADPNGLSISGGDHSSVGSMGIDSTISTGTQSTSVASASTVSWLNSRVGFYDTVDVTTTTTIVQTRMMLLLFAINVSLVAILYSTDAMAMSSGKLCLMHALLLFQGMLLACHLWSSSK